MTSIGDFVFQKCYSLASVTIGNSVTSISYAAFGDCTGLKDITIPDSVTSIGDYAFYGCTNLASVTIGNGVTSIGYAAFGGCTGLKDITIPDSVKSIGDYAFYGCTSLASVTIGNGVTSIGYAAFYGCASLADVYYAGSKTQWNTISIDSGNTTLTSAVIHYKSDLTTIILWKNNKKNGTCEQVGSLDVPFRDDWFSRPATEYNRQLGIFCADISTLGYCPAANIKSEMENLGFTIPSSLIDKSASRDEVNYFIATKPVGDDLLVLVATIGSYHDQWYSNFDPLGYGARDAGCALDATYHVGFLDAKEYVYDKIKNNYNAITNGYDKSHVKFLFTGHSRGAAAANLLAAQFIDEAQSGSNMAQTGNIYAYTFATPNVGLKDKINCGAAEYDCIFNIVNPEDFVTKVLPAQWGYGRYGVTYVLPSKTNDKHALTYEKKVKAFLKAHTDKKYGSYTFGEAETYAAVKAFTLRVKSVEDMYDEKNTLVWFDTLPLPFNMSPYVFFRDVVIAILANIDKDKTEEKAPALMGIANALSILTTTKPTVQSLLYTALLTYFLNPALMDIWKAFGKPETIPVSFLDIFIENGVDFAAAHQAETYCAFMNTVDTLMESDGTNGYRHSVNCPVDVEVYDKETGELVGRIVDNTVDAAVAAQDNAIVMLVDGDSKIFWLPENGDYEVKLIGNDTGKMDYTVSAIDSDTGETGRVNFFDVAITDGKVMTGDVSENDFTLEEYTLTTDSGAEITPTETDKEAEETFTVSTVVTGDGYATDSLSAVSGDYVTLTATPNEGSAFVGWYENGTLVSDSAEYAFVVKADRSLTAKFETIKPASVRISKMPTKTVYTYRNDTSLDLSGMELEVTYNDGSKKTVTDTSAFQVSGYSAKPRGEKTVTVEYEGLKTDFKVTVKYTWWQWLIRIFLFGFLWY